MDWSRDCIVRVQDDSLVSASLRIGWFVGVAHDCLAQDLWSTHVVRDFGGSINVPSVQLCKNLYDYRNVCYGLRPKPVDATLYFPAIDEGMLIMKQ